MGIQVSVDACVVTALVCCMGAGFWCCFQGSQGDHCQQVGEQSGEWRSVEVLLCWQDGINGD